MGRDSTESKKTLLNSYKLQNNVINLKLSDKW